MGPITEKQKILIAQKKLGEKLANAKASLAAMQDIEGPIGRKQRHDTEVKIHKLEDVLGSVGKALTGGFSIGRLLSKLGVGEANWERLAKEMGFMDASGKVDAVGSFLESLKDGKNDSLVEGVLEAMLEDAFEYVDDSGDMDEVGGMGEGLESLESDYLEGKISKEEYESKLGGIGEGDEGGSQTGNADDLAELDGILAGGMEEGDEGDEGDEGEMNRNLVLGEMDSTKELNDLLASGWKVRAVHPTDRGTLYSLYR